MLVHIYTVVQLLYYCTEIFVVSTYIRTLMHKRNLTAGMFFVEFRVNAMHILHILKTI